VMLCPLGYRVELPEFGIADPTFSTPLVDQLALRRSIEVWEPRAQLVLSQETDALDQLIQRVQVLVSVRSEE
jgi:hypothetical protein